jgi:hypothetical protein
MTKWYKEQEEMTQMAFTQITSARIGILQGIRLGENGYTGKGKNGTELGNFGTGTKNRGGRKCIGERRM